MRKLILIAGFVLASATAQAGDSRSLSLAGSDSPAATAPAKTNAAPQTAEAAEPPKADAPRYVERPQVETKSGQYRDEPRSRDESRYKDEPRKDEPRYSDKRRSYDDDDDRYDRPRRTRHWAERRIINTLHRHGIYW
jgi:hypothetical protein